MKTATIPEQVEALLTKAETGAGDAYVSLSDVSALAEENTSGELLPVQEARALLGRAFIVRTNVQWALEQADRALKTLQQQVWFAEEHEEFAGIDAERAERGDDA